MVGDVVVTSGIDGIYPKGFIIGHVESVEKSGRRYKRIIVQPAVDFSQLEEVLVVLTPTPAQRGAAEGRAGVKAAGVIAGDRASALALQTTLARFLVRGTVAVDLVLVVVVYVALTSGPVTGLLTGHRSPGWSRTRCRAASSASAGWRRRSSGSWPGIIGTQFIVAAAAAAVRRVFRRDACCTRSCSSGCTCCSTCDISARRMPRWPARRSATRSSASSRFSWSSFCRARSSGGASAKTPASTVNSR